MAMDAATLHLREGGCQAKEGEFKGDQLEGEAEGEAMGVASRCAKGRVYRG